MELTEYWLSIGTIWKPTRTLWLMFASHRTVLNTQNLNVGLGWAGLDLSQNITPPRAPCGANNGWGKGKNIKKLIWVECRTFTITVPKQELEIVDFGHVLWSDVTGASLGLWHTRWAFTECDNASDTRARGIQIFDLSNHWSLFLSQEVFLSPAVPKDFFQRTVDHYCSKACSYV